MDELMKAIAKYPNGTTLSIEWDGLCTVIGQIDTIYETCNGLDFDDPQYKEFYACAFLVTEVVGIYSQEDTVKKDDLIEVSMQRPPLRIRLQDGTIIWTRK